MPTGKTILWGLVFGVAGAILYDKALKGILKF